MSYLTSIHLEKEPFSTSPDPGFFYKSSEHYTALNRLEIAIRLKRGLSVVLGDVGTGKTTLSRALFQQFYGEEDTYVFHMILDPSFESEHQFLAHLTKLFGISPYFRSTVDHREAIEQYLFRMSVEQGKTVVLLIDEGQKLHEAQLEVLRTLLNYETNESKMLQLVIMAQLELLPKIKNMKNFMDRIGLKYMINPLNEYETSKMIQFRLAQAGYEAPENLFSREALRRIYEFTNGYPRRIARMCHQAMEELVMNDHQHVSAQVIDMIISKEKVWE